MAKARGGAVTNGSSGNGAGFGAQVQKLSAAVKALAAQVGAMGLAGLTSEQRQTSMGKLRVGEADAIETIFDAMDAFPQVFVALAPRDGGVDPNAVETAPARAALAQSLALAPVLKSVQALEQTLSDAVIAYAEQAKQVSVPAYRIGAASAPVDAALAKAMATSMDFYGHPARTVSRRKKVAATRASKAAKKAAKNPSANGAPIS